MILGDLQRRFKNIRIVFFSSGSRIHVHKILKLCEKNSNKFEIQKGAQGTILTNFSKKSFAAFLQWHPEAIHM